MELHEVVRELERRNARDEFLGRWTQRRFRQPAIVPVGRAWRLGVLLLSADGTLAEVARVTRAIEPKDFNSDKTIAGEERREEQRAAIRGGCSAGETVNHGYRELSVVEAQNLVGDAPLEQYLADRAALLPSRG